MQMKFNGNCNSCNNYQKHIYSMIKNIYINNKYVICNCMRIHNLKLIYVFDMHIKFIQLNDMGNYNINNKIVIQQLCNIVVI